ncbi:MAG: [ribosomal protein S18]-alanine N-acetyltransferase [Thermoanaerobaculia bacterium]|jgi:ribosomal protein S18 acetylase RimI-like enzyme|nr:[ribosomal protein S18]-alanine N-acetyltransferase [Thermoanaerobaculia bacterium]
MKELEIGRLNGDAEARACARMMATSDPWVFFGRTFEQCLARLTNPEGEVWVAREEGIARGFIILLLQGAFVGYIQVVCVAAEARGSGVGSKLVAFAEERIFAEFPNVFLCVSSINPRARELYERLGYKLVGELDDYLVRGYSEFLMRKSVGPLVEFVPTQA